MVIGFIGFGEAAAAIAEGLHEEGVKEMVFYDVLQNAPGKAEHFAEKSRKTGAVMQPSAAEVCQLSQIVFSAAPSNYALDAAQSALDGIHGGCIYVDVSTATPAEKKRISRLVEERGGKFVDGAMMGTLLKDRHKVNMLLCGSGAQELCDTMTPYHMRMTVVEGEPGVATSIKFIRSITAKGLSCLLLESLQAAQKFGVEDTIVDSFLDSFGDSFVKILDGYLSGAIIHAQRREHELQNVVDFLKEEGLPFTMAEATREKLQWIHDTDIKGNFENGVGRTWQAVLSGWKLNNN